jgi:carbamoyltransferase
MLLYARLTGRRPEPIVHAQFGPRVDASDARMESDDVLQATRLDEDALIDVTARALAGGQVVAWAQGAMEYGPRALGNRSFLADPRSDAIRDVINEKIKKRELFRPFAPSVKAESASDYFELRQSSPFMTIVVPVRPDKRAVIPAVTHVDGTARPQTVDRAVNPRYWKLLDRLGNGSTMLLNTSFNIQEPIVCSAADASAFERSGSCARARGPVDYPRGSTAPTSARGRSASSLKI